MAEALGWIIKPPFVTTTLSPPADIPGHSEVFKEQRLIYRMPPCKSIGEVAKALKTTPAKIKRLLKIAKVEGLAGLSKAHWKAGRPTLVHQFTDE